MNKEYKIKLDLNKKIYNKKMTFNQFDENVNDFYIEVTKNNEVVKDLDKSIVTLVAIKPNGEVDAQFIEVKGGQIYADLKPSMCDLVGNYQAKAMIVLEGEIVTTDTINYSVNEDKIISRLNEDVVSDERFTLFTDALARLSIIELSEEQRQINEAERILSEENRKIEEAKRVEAELIRQHEEADRAKYDATRESNENIRKQNESIRLSNETNRIDEEAKRVEEENKRKLAEDERNANYNFMTEDEERRRSEANAHKEAEVLRVQAETNRVNEEAKRRTTEQGRVSAENIRVSNENTREANEEARQDNEAQRIEAETQRQNRYNSFISDAEKVANDFETYTNSAKASEEERKASELDRKLQEDRRVSNEVERISNENTRKANEVVREKNEASRQDVFENKVNEVDEKIVELNTTKDNFVSSINTKVDNKISELDSAKSDMTTTVSNKVNEVETRFNALTSSQQQSSEVIDARDGETSLKARLDRDIEKAKQVYVNVEGSHISTDSSSGYAKDVEILGNTVQDASNLADIRSVGDTVEGQELYEIPILSRGKNLFNGKYTVTGNYNARRTDYIDIHNASNIIPNIFGLGKGQLIGTSKFFSVDKSIVKDNRNTWNGEQLLVPESAYYIVFDIREDRDVNSFQIEEGTVATEYEPYQEDKLTILSPVQLEKVGDVADRIIEKDGVWGVEKNVGSFMLKNLTMEGFDFSWNNADTSKVNITGSFTRAVFEKFSQNHEYGVIPVLSTLTPLCSRETLWECDVEGIVFNVNTNKSLQISINKSKLKEMTAQGFLDTIEGLVVYHKAKNSQFIPLPHDQQIKLRTFANKTNISFLTEIEGTIKAQVPKSLGATVNTHTEQISSLNKELDRVKKLEESTVSTVETESDFTTVEATSNGYFEDVKLEGKTLVNLGIEYYHKNVTSQNSIPSLIVAKTRCIKEINISGEFTIISNLEFWVSEIDSNGNVILNSNWCNPSSGYLYETSKNCSKAYFVFRKSDNSEFTSEEEFKALILEGDHTQNSPSYFEGLKSVGQSATTSEGGADEIVVSSVKGDGNLFDGTLSSWWVGGIVYKEESSKKYSTLSMISPNEVYTIKNHTREFNRALYAWLDKDFNTISVHTFTSINECTTNISPNNSKYLLCYVNSIGDLSNNDNITLNKGTTPKPYTPHQSDKKRLLYYNNETQAWEKPILREWDSIEKHSDGKYYYHQRSGEVVLNGTHSTSTYGNESDTHITFNTHIPNSNGVANGNLICDKFKRASVLTNNDCVWMLTPNNFYIRLNKSLLITQDVAGFKQWLQANNVTVVYQLAQEKVYECTNIDLITYANETNYIVESGVIVPKTTLKVHNNISNVVNLLQKKVSLLESNITSYMITQNRLMLASRYNADTVSFKVDVASFSDTFEYDNDLYELILNNILVGKDNYNREYIENLIIFYWMDFIISDEMYLTLFEIIEEQHNPKVIEAPIE